MGKKLDHYITLSGCCIASHLRLNYVPCYSLKGSVQATKHDPLDLQIFSASVRSDLSLLHAKAYLPSCYKHSVPLRLIRSRKEGNGYRRLSATVRVAVVFRVLQTSHLILQLEALAARRQNKVFVLSQVSNQRDATNNTVVCYRSPSHRTKSLRTFFSS